MNSKPEKNTKQQAKKLKVLRLRSKTKRRKRPRPIEGPKVGFYLLPNLLTAASLFCGFLAVLRAFDGHYTAAAWLILASIILDGLDGRVARLTRTTSEFGLHFDSLSDLITFGAAPAVMIYYWALRHSFMPSLGKLIAFAYLLCGALRLARFNVLTTKSDANTFVGLPIPGAAGVLLSIVLFFHNMGWAKAGEPAPVPALILIATGALAYLMICSIEYPSFKDINLFRRQPPAVLLLVTFAVAVIVLEPEKTLFAILTLYALSGPIWQLFRHTEEETTKSEA